MRSALLLFFTFTFLLNSAQEQVVQAFVDSTAHIYLIEGAPATQWSSRGDELLLAVSEGGQYVTFVLNQKSVKKYPLLNIIEFSSEQLEVPFFNWSKLYGTPVCKNDTISFMFEMPFRATQYTAYFVLEKQKTGYTGVKYLYTDYQDQSEEAIRKAEEALAIDSVSYAIEWYNAVQYPQYYLNEKEVGFSLMEKAHTVALSYYKNNVLIKASNVMRSAIQYYENSLHLEYKTIEEMNTDLADTTNVSWTIHKMKLWLGDYGLFLYKAKDYEASIQINSYLTKLFPTWANPYLQLGDAYYDKAGKMTADADEAYRNYSQIMQELKKKKLIPKRVNERIKGCKTLR